MASPIVGARTLPQLDDNLGAVSLALPDEILAGLERASAPTLGFPHDFLAMPLTRTVLGGGSVIEPRPF